VSVVTSADRAFLGVGWAFPPAPTPTGDVAMAAYDEDVRQAVLIILQTTPGERVMRPQFGAGLADLVFEPITTTLLALIKHRVETALIQWEPRIDIDAVTVTPTPALGRVDIDIRYQVRQTSTFYNLVYPFYLNEGGGQ
jgi:phage baseplate assembly protein W